MKPVIISVLKWVALFAIAFLLLILFFPQSYKVQPLLNRKGTKYWELATGSRIAYSFIEGKGARKPYPLIYLHGGPGAGITNLEIKKLSPLADEGYDIYLYDQVGCGHSNRLENIREYTAKRQEKDLEQIVRNIGSQKVILIAQSWGSILAVMFVADHPELVEKIAVTAPGPIQPGNINLAAIAAPDSLHFRDPYRIDIKTTRAFRNLRFRTTIYLANKFGMKFESDKEADEYSAAFTSELNKTQVCDVSNAVRSEGPEGFYVNLMTKLSLGSIADPRPKIKNSQIPILIMKAQCDNQKWGYTKEYLDLFPNHRFVLIPGSGHNAFIEQPALYLKALRDFLY
ncbi:MAG: alpha/beta hydrolase [Flavitalea sp.]